MLRRLNQRLGRGVRRDTQYDELVLGMLATETLRSSLAADPAAPELHGWAEERGESSSSGSGRAGSTSSAIATTSCRAPATPDVQAPGPGPPRRSSRAALDALAAMTREAAERPDPDDTLLGKVRRARKAAQR